MNVVKSLALAGYVMMFAGAAAAVAATSVTISQKGKAFSEKKVSLGVGDSLKFLNDDEVGHNILIKDMDFNAGVANPGEDVVVKFEQTGKFKVRCGIHPRMKLTVMVE